MARQARAQLPTGPALIHEPAAEWLSIDDLDLWVDNPRDNENSVEPVMQLLIAYGFGTAMMAWPDPANANRLRIIAGNTRKKSVLRLRAKYSELKATHSPELDAWHPGAIRIGETGMVPVRIREDLTEQQATELALADNKSNELAQWDRKLVAKILQNIPTITANLIGWKDNELARILRRQHPLADVEPKIEHADELRLKWKTKAGQLWRCGVHLVLCGDSRDPSVIQRVMAGQRATLGMMDPPYGVDLGAKNRLLNTVQKSGRCLTDIEDDALDPVELKARLLPTLKNYVELVAAEDCTHFVFSPQGGDLGMMMLELCRDAGMPARHVLIWQKNQSTFSMGRLDYDYKHEPILMGWGKRHKKIMEGQFKTSVWEVDRPRASPDHPTPKPVPLYENALLNHTEEGDIGFDGYAGSGPMVIACEQTRRIARCVEKSPGYVAVILQRWFDATQDLPVLVT